MSELELTIANLVVGDHIVTTRTMTVGYVSGAYPVYMIN